MQFIWWFFGGFIIIRILNFLNFLKSILNQMKVIFKNNNILVKHNRNLYIQFLN